MNPGARPQRFRGIRRRSSTHTGAVSASSTCTATSSAVMTVAFTRPRSGAHGAELGHRAGCPAGAELGGGSADDDPGEAQVGVLVAPPADERVESGLARPVRDEEGARILDRDRRQEQRPSAARLQVRDGVAAHEGGADDVGLEHRVPLVGRRVEEPAQRRHPGRVDQRVESTERADGFVDQASAVVRRAHVGADTDHLAVALRDELVEPVGPSPGCDDASAGGGGRHRDGSPDARGRAHDQQAAPLDARGLGHRRLMLRAFATSSRLLSLR